MTDPDHDKQSTEFEYDDGTVYDQPRKEFADEAKKEEDE